MPTLRSGACDQTADNEPAGDTALDDPLYTPQEIAKSLKVSDDYVRRLFEREQGVIFLPSPGKESKRRYRTMRVPKSVLRRVCASCMMGHN